jgi:hypothetical protein
MFKGEGEGKRRGCDRDLGIGVKSLPAKPAISRSSPLLLFNIVGSAQEVHYST